MTFYFDNEFQRYCDEQNRKEHQRIKEEIELEEKIFRISHPILAKLDDARFWVARKIIGI